MCTVYFYFNRVNQLVTVAVNELVSKDLLGYVIPFTMKVLVKIIMTLLLLFVFTAFCCKYNGNNEGVTSNPAEIDKIVESRNKV